MSFDGMDREVVQTNADAFTSSSENGFYNFIGNTENQANRIFENLDQFKTREDGSYDDAVKEYKKVFDQYNKADTADELPDIQLVDYDNDGDMDIRLMNGKEVETTYTNRTGQ